MALFICTLLITSTIFFNPVESSSTSPRRDNEQRNGNDRRLVGVNSNGSLYYPISTTGPTETGSAQQTSHPQTPVRVRLLPDGRVDGVYRNGRLVYINAVERDIETGSVHQPRHQQPRLHQTPNEQSPLPVAVAIVYNNGRPVFPVPREIPVPTADLLPDGALVFRDSSVIGRIRDEQIYESNPTGPDGHARRIKPRHGDLVINNGRPVSIYDNNSFRAYRIPPQI